MISINTLILGLKYRLDRQIKIDLDILSTLILIIKLRHPVIIKFYTFIKFFKTCYLFKIIPIELLPSYLSQIILEIKKKFSQEI